VGEYIDLGQPLDELADGGGLLQVGAHSDDAVVAQEDSIAFPESGAGVVGQFLAPRDGVFGDSDGAAQEHHLLVEDGRYLQASHGQGAGIERVGVDDGPTSARARYAARWTSVSLEGTPSSSTGSLRVDDQDVIDGQAVVGQSRA
jgi:hypothetical protein